MSNLNEFLVQLQRCRFVDRDGAEILFCAFGDSAFNLGMQCIQSCYCEFHRGAELEDSRSKRNTAMRAARIPNEKNYGMVSNLFRLCAAKEGSKIAKRNPVVLEQLRISHFLTNCYLCFNGDQAGSVNTFSLSPPVMEGCLNLFG
jgi:hypothetical protein